jgi:hypothetical protein
MKLERIAVNARALLRADSIIADVRAKHLLTRSSVTAFAALIAAFGVLMFSIAGYFALEVLWGRIWAAAIVGLANCVMACILVLIAFKLKPSRELDLAREVHKSAATALFAECQRIAIELESFRQRLRNPLDSLLPALIVPFAGTLLKTIKKRSKTAGEPNAENRTSSTQS